MQGREEEERVLGREERRKQVKMYYTEDETTKNNELKKRSMELMVVKQNIREEEIPKCQQTQEKAESYATLLLDYNYWT